MNASPPAEVIQQIVRKKPQDEAYCPSSKQEDR